MTDNELADALESKGRISFDSDEAMQAGQKQIIAALRRSEPPSDMACVCIEGRYVRISYGNPPDGYYKLLPVEGVLLAAKDAP